MQANHRRRRETWAAISSESTHKRLLLPICALLCCSSMTIKKQLRLCVGEKNARHMSRAMPFVAGVAAAVAIGNIIQRSWRSSDVVGVEGPDIQGQGNPSIPSIWNRSGPMQQERDSE